MRLIRGAAGSGKTALVLREFKAALTSGAAARIIVPTSTLVRHYQHELARDGLVIAPSAITSLNRLIQERAPGLIPAPEGLLNAVTRDCLQRLRLPEFAAVLHTEGMVETIMETLGLFENAGATPEKIASFERRLPHARAFSRLWQAIESALHQSGFATRAELMRTAAAANPAGGPKPYLWLDGFFAFSPLERELVQALDAASVLTLTLPAAATDEMHRFALSLGAKDELLPGASRRPPVTLIEARSTEREADEIARCIIEQNRAGVPFRNIGIALRDTGLYLPLLRITLERFGIPARFYFSQPLRHHPVAVFLNGLVNGVLNAWDFQTALDTFRAHPKWGTRAAFDRFDFAVREAMPGKGAEAFLALCEDEPLKAALAECLAVTSWTAALHTPDAWARRFERMATRLYRPGVWNPEGGQAALDAFRSHAAALDAWLATVASIAPFWPEPLTPVPLQEFWRIAGTALDAALFRVPDDRSNVVHIMSAHEARQWDLSVLFVCGMLDRDYPRRPPPNLLFSESDLEVLHRARIPVRRASEYSADETALFEALKTRASEALFLSWPQRDSAGRGAEPSRLLAEFQQPPVRPAPCWPAPAAEPVLPAADGRIDTPELQAELAGLHRRISLSGLEDLAQCRFRFFAGRTLYLKGAPETPGQRLQPRLTGLILHEALELWLSDTQQDFVSLFEKAFDDACTKHRLPSGYRLEVERIKFREIAEQIKASEQWEADATEVEASFTLDFPGGITVTCRVDRIDRFGDECVIIDYKSSKTENVKKIPQSTTKLQGPLYAMAVRAQRGLTPVAVLFWAVRDDERFGWGRIPGTDQEFLPIPPRWMEDAQDRIVARLGDFLAGNVYPKPEETDGCRFCDFASVCRVESQPAVIVETIGGAARA